MVNKGKRLAVIPAVIIVNRKSSLLLRVDFKYPINLDQNNFKPKNQKIDALFS